MVTMNEPSSPPPDAWARIVRFGPVLVVVFCAALLVPALDANLRALRTRFPAHPALGRFAELGRLLTDRPQAGAADALDWLHSLVADLGLPGLGAYGVGPADFPALVAAAARSSSMKANPLELSPEELHAILARAL